MKKRTIILTQKQLDEIIGGGHNSPYLDGSDVHNNANYISTDGDSDETTQTTDNYAASLPRGSYRRTGVITMREDNERLKTKKFGAVDGEPGKSYDATKMTISRANKAKETIQTGATPEIKNKAAETLRKMENNNDVDLTTLNNQYNTAKTVDKNIRKNKVENGERVLKSSPKTHTGTAHSIKNNNGFITYK